MAVPRVCYVSGKRVAKLRSRNSGPMNERPDKLKKMMRPIPSGSRKAKAQSTKEKPQNFTSSGSGSVKKKQK